MKKVLFLCFSVLCFYSFSQDEGIKEIQLQEYELKYIYNKGDISVYSLNIENYEKLNVSGQVGEKRRKTVIKFSQQVENVDENGNGIIKLKYLEGSYNNIKIDIGGKEGILKRDPQGRILESSGLEEASMEFVKIIQKSMADYLPGFDRLPVKIDLSKFDSNVFNPYFEAFTPILPDKKVKIGDSWEREIIVPFLFVKGKLVYKLDKIEENKAYIKLSLSKQEIKGTGDIIFDIEKGKLIEENFIIKGEDIKTKLDLGKYTQYKQIYEISGTIIIKINLKEI